MKAPFLLLLAMAMAAPLAAQGWIEPLPGHRPNPTVVKLRTNVTATVSGRVARVEVEEWFINRGGGMGEGDYLYPLPGEAVFSEFSLFQGDQELRGETMDAARARGIYEDIVRRKKDPALIELAGHGLVRARVFPLSPSETRKITLRYTQLLPRAGDALEFRYAAGGRTTLARSTSDGGPRTVRGEDGAPLTFHLVVEDGAGFRDPFSPTQEVRSERTGGRLTVRPANTLSGDFVLFLPLARGLVGMTVATHRPNSEPGYFMLTLSPGASSGPAQPRDVTVVLDVSGSMSGAKLDQAKRALRQLLASLGRGDRFRLIAFSSAVTVYRSGWTEVERAAIEEGTRWVDGLSAGGGTNIAGALDEAFRHHSESERLPIVVFLTDGLPSIGEQNPERLAQQAEQARENARVFAFGVGYDVNTYLLDRLSAAGRGATQYVQPGEDVEEELGRLVAKISHPVLTDLAIAQAPVHFTEVYPARLPDLFAGEDLVVFGRYDGEAAESDGRVVLTGRRNGRTERFEVRAVFAAPEIGNAFLPRLWAARKVGVLQQSLRLNGPNTEVEKEIRDTALRYGLVTEFTSYLVQEPLDVAQRPDLRRTRSFQLPAAEPAAATGRLAVQAAERDRQRREAKSVATLEADERAQLDGIVDAGTRLVSGRVFRVRDGAWTDVAHTDSLRVVRIQAFSDAYFALLRRLPELKPYVQAFDNVLVAGARASIAVGPEGVAALSERELDRLAATFRGR